MNFHSVPLTDKLIQRTHDLCLKHGVKDDFVRQDEEEDETAEQCVFFYKIEEAGEQVEDERQYVEFKMDGREPEYVPLPNTKNTRLKEKTLYITLYDDDLVQCLREIMENAELHSNQPCIELQSLYWGINDLRIRYKDPTNQINGFKKLKAFTEELFKDKFDTMDRLIDSGKITFDALWYLYDKVGALYFIEKFEEDICVRHQSFYYTETDDGDIDKLELHSHVITLFNGKAKKEECTYIFKKFPGTREIATFKIKKVTEADKITLLVNAERTLELAQGYKHMFLDGSSYSKHPSPLGDLLKRELKERVMVDQDGYKKFGQGLNIFIPIQVLDEELATDDKYIIFPFLSTYNLGVDKTWGVSHVSALTSIAFQENSFDHLVLTQEKKEIIQALVSNRTIEYKDFISDKGNNTIILLSGSPGVGKSLTAEATAEYLKKPLYRINVGDLGTNPEHMETILNEIFKLTERWDAIVLIDEVDIFIEERSDYNITHNAMVCTFMKILDYNNCVIFLTTNRLHSIDSAVRSRINLLLHYSELTKKNRMEIWKGLLDKWDIRLSTDTVSELGRKEINGREIRNYIKTVISIHKQKKTEITDKSMLATFELVYQMTTEFDQKTKNMYA